MLNFGNKEFRNLQEQVAKNQDDISALEFGLNIRGSVENVPLLPRGVEVGVAYFVGKQAPFHVYVKVGEPHEWLNLGTLESTVEGPVGPEGAEGIAGKDGSIILTGSEAPHIAAKENDLYIQSNGFYYTYNKNHVWELKGTLQGPQGPVGARGLTGEKGPQGERGPIGPQGPKGYAITILGKLASTSLLPNPATVSRNAGYIIAPKKPDAASLLYGIVEDSGHLSWANFGAITSLIFGTVSGTAYEGNEGQKNREMIQNIIGSLADKADGKECMGVIYGKEFMDEIYLAPEQYENKILFLSIEGDGTYQPSTAWTPAGDCLGYLDRETQRLVVLSTQGVFILDRLGNTEKVGDLDDYFTKDEINNKLASFITRSEVDAKTDPIVLAGIDLDTFAFKEYRPHRTFVLQNVSHGPATDGVLDFIEYDTDNFTEVFYANNRKTYIRRIVAGVGEDWSEFGAGGGGGGLKLVWEGSEILGTSLPVEPDKANKKYVVCISDAAYGDHKIFHLTPSDNWFGLTWLSYIGPGSYHKYTRKDVRLRMDNAKYWFYVSEAVVLEAKFENQNSDNITGWTARKIVGNTSEYPKIESIHEIL